MLYSGSLSGSSSAVSPNSKTQIEYHGALLPEIKVYPTTTYCSLTNIYCVLAPITAKQLIISLIVLYIFVNMNKITNTHTHKVSPNFTFYLLFVNTISNYLFRACH